MYFASQSFQRKLLVIAIILNLNTAPIAALQTSFLLSRVDFSSKTSHSNTFNRKIKIIPDLFVI